MKKVILLQSVQGMNAALFILYLVRAKRLGAYPKFVKAMLPKRQTELKAEGKIIGVPARPTAHLLDRPSFTQRVVQGVAQSIADKPECIQKIAFAGAVSADEKHEVFQFHIAKSNAFVVPYDDAADKRRIHRCFQEWIRD